MIAEMINKLDLKCLLAKGKLRLTNCKLSVTHKNFFTSATVNLFFLFFNFSPLPVCLSRPFVPGFQPAPSFVIVWQKVWLDFCHLHKNLHKMASGGSAAAETFGFAVEMKRDCPHVQVFYFRKKLHV